MSLRPLPPSSQSSAAAAAAADGDRDRMSAPSCGGEAVVCADIAAVVDDDRQTRYGSDLGAGELPKRDGHVDARLHDAV